MVSTANKWSTLHTRGLPRKLDAKTFRGDVSEKFQVHRTSSQYTVRELKLFDLESHRFSNHDRLRIAVRDAPNSG
jgi:hypothetical protein